MNCQEVMDYMQRELDGDLGEFECAVMREHIRQCADCAAMYERLKRLSAELENLPKVTPPFSLVDAILPKLDEIDRARAAAGADTASAEFAAPAGSASQAAPRRRISRFNLRVLGGVVAAGIVAGIFLVSYDQGPLINVYSGGGSGNAVMESASSGASAKADAMVTMSGDSAFEVADQYGVLGQQIADAGSPGDQAASVPTAEATIGSVEKIPLDRSVDRGNEANGGNGSVSVDGSDALTGPAAGATSGSGETVGRMEAPDVLRGEPDGVGVAESEWLEDQTWMGFFGFAEEPAPVAEPVGSVSPDGSYVAVFADSRVIIYDRDGNTWFEGEEREGAIVAMGWTSDGVYFRYEVRHEDGTGEIYRIDPVQGTETRE